MDWLRIVLVFIAYCQLDVSITSPQQASEMGQKPGDKPYKDDDPPSLKRKQSYRALFSILSLYHLYWYGSEQVSNLEWIGFLALSGLIGLRIWCFITLNQFFTFGLGIREGHELIKTGPYKYLIHPSYTGQIGHLFIWLAWIRTPFLFHILLTIMVLRKLYRRIDWEEKMMTDHFKKEYIDHCESRYRLIPFIY